MQPLSKAMAAQPITGEAKLVELTQWLTRFGARTQVIVALTGLNEKKVRPIIKSIIGDSLVRGPCQFPTAQFFAGALKKRNPAANLHSTIFLSLYVKLRDACFSEAMHEGYLLASAFEGYSEMLEANPDLNKGEAVLDVNRAYALVRCFEGKELALVGCDCCESKYLSLEWVEPEAVNCPICTKTAHRKYLAEIGKQGGRRRLA